MSKDNRSLVELQKNVDDNLVVRRNELIVLKSLVEKNENKIEGRIFAKNLIVMLYSHWEGFIKYASESFIQYMSHQNLKYKELNYGLLAVSTISEIHSFIESNVALKIKALECILHGMEKKASIPYNYVIATYSNLNTETLEEICMIVGINQDHYATKRGIIDEKLLKNRNEIAHGNLVRIEPSYSLEIFDLIFPLIEAFKTDILNKAVEYHNLKTI